jgi:protein-S-isoprenylcysteine O-methyltransferase Ste14
VNSLTPEALAGAGYAFGLWTGWGVLHSVLAARRVKAAFELLLGPRYAFYPLGYSAVSLWTFSMVFQKEPDLPQVLWAVDGVFAFAMYALQLVGLALLLWAGVSMHGLKMLGVTQLVSLLRGRLAEEADMRKDFTSTGAYGVVRHPMHLGGMLFLAFQPRLTLGGCAFALFGCLYMVLGSWLEERRLALELGPVWADYARRVPMFIPRFWPGA